jgi:hypothetical protein
MYVSYEQRIMGRMWMGLAGMQQMMDGTFACKNRSQYMVSCEYKRLHE